VSITPELLEKIEKKTKELIKAKLKFEKKIVTKEQARQIFKDQKYKLELIEELPENEEISTYTCGSFTDLCRGPHVESSAFIKANAVKLLSTAGAYWRGDEKNPMLQRIYGTAWKDRADLDAHLKKLKEIKERDHRVLGKSLDLFSLHPEAGAGLVYWTARGSRIRNQIEMFWKQAHYENGYELLYTPHVGKSWLWETSGHLGFYDENMYSPMQIDDENYYIKPMNCPFHILLYNDKGRSYRELPMRLAEMRSSGCSSFRSICGRVSVSRISRPIWPPGPKSQLVKKSSGTRLPCLWKRPLNQKKFPMKSMRAAGLFTGPRSTLKYVMPLAGSGR
jgi:threonyl-tRNA synthetase